MRIRSLTMLVVATALTLTVAAPAHAADTTPPTAPGTPAVSNLTETSVTLTWAPSTDDIAVANYEVWRIYTDIVQLVGSPTATTFTVTGLNRGSQSRFYIVAVDSSGNRSRSSALVPVTTLPGDLEPPGPVIGGAASEITDTTVRISWQGAWWGDVDTFRIYRAPGTGGSFVLVTSVAANVRTVVVTGLSPATQYRFSITARDAAGNESGPSLPVPVTTTGGPTPTPTCTVAYRVISQWTGGFVAEVRITNTGTSAVNGWSLAWTFANGQRITNLWNGNVTPPAASVTVTNMPYNAVLGANGGSQTFGFQGTWSGSNPSPAPFTLNNAACQAV